jgi:hypothetical protein
MAGGGIEEDRGTVLMEEMNTRTPQALAGRRKELRVMSVSLLSTSACSNSFDLS